MFFVYLPKLSLKREINVPTALSIKVFTRTYTYYSQHSR